MISLVLLFNIIGKIISMVILNISVFNNVAIKILIFMTKIGILLLKIPIQKIYALIT
jgi:hypothetical protein